MYLFENSDFIVADKPAGWLSVPSRAGASDTRICLGIRIQEEKGRVWPVHRLDLEVSGLILFARNEEAHRLASLAFEQRRVSKSYEALSALEPVETYSSAHEELMPWTTFESGVIWECKLTRGKKRAFQSPHGKESRTRAKCLGAISKEACLLWNLEPLTGRSHQLRYEMSRHGFPILGDELYGAKTSWASEGIALRAVKLDFTRAPELGERGLPPTLQVNGLISI
jgi:tRNA pseudouridine32 synthase / 23S rRNA pseudouridine746 synthase